MATPEELKSRFWTALKSDMTMMIGLDGVEDGHARPMSAQIESEAGPIWFFTAKDNTLCQLVGDGGRANATFTSKRHDLFATLHGRLKVDTDRAVVDRLWNRGVAAWYEDGKTDPRLALLRLDPEYAEIWLDTSSLVAGIKMLLGADPQADYRESMARVELR